MPEKNTRDAFITTKDNPFNPFTNFIAWFKYDSIKGYNTCSIIDNLADTSNVFGEEVNDAIIYNAMLKIIGLDYENKYVIVYPSDYEGDKLLIFEGEKT